VGVADQRGFAAAVWDLVRRIPAGRVTTYGQLAEAVNGVARGARQAGRAMARCPDGLPWWRVVHADGSMKGGPGSDEQLARLAEEGVPLRSDGRVDWSRCGGPWSPEQRFGTSAAHMQVTLE
jgi:methylated-DNA-protein-cysteine methyltransferase related protein